MALAAVQPMLMDVMDTLMESTTAGQGGRVLAEIVVEDEAAPLARRTIHEVFPPDGGLQVLGIERGTRGIEVGPHGNTMLETGDRIMVYGESEALEQLSPTSSPGMRSVVRPG